MKAFVVLLCFALFASTLASSRALRDNTKETPDEGDNDKDAVDGGEKDPKDSEKFLFGPLLGVLSSLTGLGGHGGGGGFGHHHGGHHHHHRPPFGYPPYGGFGHYPPYGYY